MLAKGFSVPELLQPALPAAISWFPLPPGWYVLGALLGGALLILIFFRFARWRRNLWRRQALTSLQQPHNVDSWLSLIKRILLIHHPRAQISHYLEPEQLLQHVPLDGDLRHQLSTRYCQPDNQLDADQTARLRSQLHLWLEALPYV